MYLQLSVPRGCIITLRQRLVRIARLDTSAHKRAHWNVKHALQAPRHWWRDLKCALVSLSPSIWSQSLNLQFCLHQSKMQTFLSFKHQQCTSSQQCHQYKGYRSRSQAFKYFSFLQSLVRGSNRFSRIKDESGWGYTMLTQFNLFFINAQIFSYRIMEWYLIWYLSLATGRVNSLTFVHEYSSVLGRLLLELWI